MIFGLIRFLKSIILLLGILIVAVVAMVFFALGPVEIPWVQEVQDRYKGEVTRVIGDVLIKPAVSGLDEDTEHLKSEALTIRIDQTDIDEFINERILDGTLAPIATLDVVLRRGFVAIEGSLSVFSEIPFSILFVPTVNDGTVKVHVQSIDIGVVAVDSFNNQFVENVRTEIQSVVSGYLRSNGLTIEAVDVQNGYLLLTIDGI
tara:strand:+ start:1832 stop:2443 length:612 start_codon:yes stop_codon:yes gene_type:complete